MRVIHDDVGTMRVLLRLLSVVKILLMVFRYPVSKQIIYYHFLLRRVNIHPVTILSHKLLIYVPPIFQLPFIFEDHVNGYSYLLIHCKVHYYSMLMILHGLDDPLAHRHVSYDWYQINELHQRMFLQIVDDRWETMRVSIPSHHQC